MTDELAAIRRPFGMADLAPLLDRAGVDATIVVQARSSLDESHELLATAAAWDRIAGVVAWADLTSPSIGDDLAALRAAVGGRRLVGIRHQVHDEPDPDWLLRPDVVRGLVAVASAGLAYDLLVRARELPAALEIARTIPGLRLVIDHLAKPPIRAGGTAPWSERLAPFGALPNVWCKLSGLLTEAGWSAWRVDDLRPAVDLALALFGPDRLVFGTDWPVSLLAAPYEVVVATTRELIDGLSGDERAAVMGGSAVEVYALHRAGWA
jgi:L-fuconolactonase